MTNGTSILGTWILRAFHMEDQQTGRRYDLDGDTLKIITDPGKTPRTGGAIVVGTLEWERETG